MRLIAEEKRLMPHFHLSVQSGDDMVLKRMKRRHLRADTMRFVEAVRRAGLVRLIGLRAAAVPGSLALVSVALAALGRRAVLHVAEQRLERLQVAAAQHVHDRRRRCGGRSPIVVPTAAPARHGARGGGRGARRRPATRAGPGPDGAAPAAITGDSRGSSPPSHFAITALATAFPITLVAVRPMSRK